MDSDEKDKLYKAGFNAGQEHSKPSAQTIEFMNTTSNNITQMKEQIKQIHEKLGEMPTKDEMSLAMQKIVESVMSSADSRYAGKVTERIVYTFVGMVLIAFGGGLIGLIIKMS